jgi:raffinose/stachyose/melibiose transport system permease protein
MNVISAKHLRRLSAYSGLVLLVLVWMVPFIYIVLNSLKSNADFLMRGPFAFPQVLQFKNYFVAWKTIDVYYGNSILITFVSVPILILFSSLAAFSLARYSFALNPFLAIFFLVGFMIPVHVTALPLYMLFRTLGILGTRFALILTYVAFNLSFTIYLMRGYFVGIPKEIEESALMDGSSSWRIYANIVIPMSLPIIVIAVVLNFMGVWNEFFFALVFLQENAKMPITLGLLKFVREYAIHNMLTEMTAGMILSMLPVLILFLIFQRYLVVGLAEGAIKG